MLANRTSGQILKSVFGRQHYVALANMLRNYPDFLDGARRYLTGSGDYPHEIKIRTPAGVLKATLYSHHDMLTVNEIFCRLDYFADESIATVVDIGSNIGISALYFLSRNSTSRCYLYEPDKRNIEKLTANLSAFADRYRLCDKAVSNERGLLPFGIEPTGRYGGIGIAASETITVECLQINDVLAEIIDKEGSVDVLKIDTEGAEIKTVEAIDHGLLRHVKRIYMEARPVHQLLPGIFRQNQYGTVCRLTNNRC